MAVGKQLRFEVFKRDSFTCQYCGKKAPDVVLHCDHIEPKSKGGTDDLINLITSCIDCNLGKGAKRISDTSKMDMARQQMDEIQERRSQLEMMVEWHKSLLSVNKHGVDLISQHFRDLTKFGFSEKGLRDVEKLIKRFSFEEVLEATTIAADKYFDGTEHSAEQAFSKIQGICSLKRAEKENPDIQKIYYIRGILRNRFTLTRWNNIGLIPGITQAATRIPIDEIMSAAKSASSFQQFEDEVLNA